MTNHGHPVEGLASDVEGLEANVMLIDLDAHGELVAPREA